MRTYRVQGTSMLPVIYPRDTVHVREAQSTLLTLGALVAYPGRGVMVCHRIVGEEQRPEGRWLHVRGDAHRRGEWVSAGSIAFVVVEVEGRLGRWRVEGRRGCWFARWALSPGGVAQAARLGSASLMRRAAALRMRTRRRS